MRGRVSRIVHVHHGNHDALLSGRLEHSLWNWTRGFGGMVMTIQIRKKDGKLLPNV